MSPQRWCLVGEGASEVELGPLAATSWVDPEPLTSAPEDADRRVDRAIEALGGFDAVVLFANGAGPPDASLAAALERRVVPIVLASARFGAELLVEGGGALVIGAEPAEGRWAATVDGALRALVRSGAKELGPRQVTVNLASPVSAGLLRFLASEDGGFITGEHIEAEAAR